jgi:serine/threonine protein phosphatase PrpC
MLAASLGADHKVRGGSALAALARSLSEDRLSARSDGSAGGAPSPRGAAPPSPPPRAGTLPLDIAAARRAPADDDGSSATGSARSSAPLAGSSGRRALLSCFGSLGGGLGSRLFPPDDEDALAACEAAVRPSFYWVAAPARAGERAEAEAAARAVKPACQDDARVLRDFAGVPGLTFAGVFDGHGPHGRAAAKFAAEALPRALAAQAAALHSRSERRRLRAMREACREVNAAMRDRRAAGFDASLSGTTACFALVQGGSALVASVGDSRAVLARRRADGSLEAAPLTLDAKPELPEEARRVAAAGGVVRQLRDGAGARAGPPRVFRRGDDVLPGLAMSRSLGDLYAHAVGVTWEPHLSAHHLAPGRDLFLVLATDGLWDALSSEAAVDFVDRYRAARAPGLSCAEALALEAQERWKAGHAEALVDDVGVVVLHAAALPPPAGAGAGGEGASAVPARALARAGSCNDEACALAEAWAAGAAEGNPSRHSPRRYFERLYPAEAAAAAAAATAAAAAAAAAPPAPASPAAGSAAGSPPRRAPASSALSIPARRAAPARGARAEPASPPAVAAAAMAGSAPGRAPRGGMPPIRKAYPSSSAMDALHLVPSWDGGLGGLESPPDEGSAGAGGGGGGGGGDAARFARHEGKVHRGVPASLSSGGGLAAAAGAGGRSGDSDADGRSSSLGGSLEERGGGLGRSLSGAGLAASPGEAGSGHGAAARPPLSPARPGAAGARRSSSFGSLRRAASGGFAAAEGRLRVVREAHAPQPSP